MKKGTLFIFLLAVVALQAKPPKRYKKPKNVIIMIGDGLGLAQLCAAYASNQDWLSLFSLASVIGLSNTSSADDFITDSAAGATAISTGVKTNNGMISTAPDSSALTTLFQIAKTKGMSTGVVVTCPITHATPASFFAHNVYRRNNLQIAQDFYNQTLDIAVGGGLCFFDTNKLHSLGYQVQIGGNPTIQSKKYVQFYDTVQNPKRILDGRPYGLQASYSLQAIKNLNNKKGFMLMIEGSQIDWGGHANDSNYVLTETLDFDTTIAQVLKWALADKETLVIITSDHETGGLGLMGYDKVNKKPEMKFFNTHHSGIMVPVFAFGPGSQEFAGVYQNTSIFTKIVKIKKW